MAKRGPQTCVDLSCARAGCADTGGTPGADLQQYDSCIGEAVPGTLASLSQVHQSLVPYHLKEGVSSVKFDAFVIMLINANSI